MPLTVPSLSRQYILLPVVATEEGQAVDPTGDTVEVAFVAAGLQPGSGDWVAADWETSVNTAGETSYSVRCLIGPGGTINLDVGTYYMWVRISDGSEIPVFQPDTIRIT